MEVYAYARVSARDQNLTRQLDAFAAFGILPSHIFCDKKSGGDFDRSGYRSLMSRLRRGDLLVIKSIDRLGRNYEMIIDEWRAITEKKDADILVLDMPLLDTRSKEGGLVSRFISDVVLQVLSFVAENERENIRARQGRAAAAPARGECALEDRGGNFPPRCAPWRKITSRAGSPSARRLMQRG